jgi:hypothetical protein
MDGDRARTTPPTRELGGCAARIGAARFFLGNGGPMRDLNGSFFTIRTGNRRLLCKWGSDGGSARDALRGGVLRLKKQDFAYQVAIVTH